MMPLVRERLAASLSTSRRRFAVLISGVLLITTVMVTIAFNLYRNSGVEQVDMSLPKYQSVRAQASYEGKAQAFSANGEIDRDTMRDFLSQYDERAAKITPVQNFSNDALSDKSLGLDPTADGAATY